MIPEKDRSQELTNGGQDHSAAGPDLAASAQAGATHRPGPAQAPDLVSMEAFLVNRATDLAKQESAKADQASSLAGALANAPSASGLAKAAAHLEAMDSHRLATYWYRESMADQGAQAPLDLSNVERHTAAADLHSKAWMPAFESGSSASRDVVMDMAATYYASSWQSALQEAGYSFPQGTRIDLESPGPDSTAIARAIRDAQSLCANNGAPDIETLLQRAAAADGHDDVDRVVSEGFGSDMALEMLGTGSSWKDDHQDFGYTAPSTEFHVGNEEAILRWMRPGTREDFCGYIAHDLEDAMDQHEEAGGFLLRTASGPYVVCDEDQAKKAWGRSEEDLARLEASNFSEA